MTDELGRRVAAAAFVEELFDRIDDVVYFVKDLEGRYLVVNTTLAARCGRRSKAELIGRTTMELFPAPLGDRFLAQDRSVMASGVPISGRLELHLYPDRLQGWCFTDKTPVVDGGGSVIGLAGISRDLQPTVADDPVLGSLARAVAWVEEHYAEEVKVAQLAELAGLSVYQLTRRMRALLRLTPGQLLTRTRIDAAARLLRSSEQPVAAVAAACGYCDQSAFARQFKAAVGLTPSQYRDLKNPASEPG